LRSFESHLDAFDARRVRLLAISVDPPETNRAHCRQQGYTFTFLSDVNSQVIRAYDLVHKGGAPEGGDISRPAEFLLDRFGVVRWRNLTESVIVRARPEQLLAAIEDLRISPESKP
jgi:peroxiredoxin